MTRKEIHNKYGKTMVVAGDKFIWNQQKWFVVEFVEGCQVAVRYEGTGDIAVLPEVMVSELIDEYESLYYSMR